MEYRELKWSSCSKANYLFSEMNFLYFKILILKQKVI